MTITRLARTALVLGAVGLALACADAGRVTAPTQARLHTASRLPGLRLASCAPLPADSASALVGPAGGTIRVGPHALAIPAGALADTVTITARIAADSVDLVTFGPSGLTFARPAALTMSYASCGVLDWLLPKSIVYADAQWNILDVLPTLDDALSQTVRANIGHFSGYAVAW